MIKQDKVTSPLHQWYIYALKWCIKIELRNPAKHIFKQEWMEIFNHLLSFELIKNSTVSICQLPYSAAQSTSPIWSFYIKFNIKTKINWIDQ